MADPEKREEVRDTEQKPPVRRVIGFGLSPAVERLFGALADEPSAVEAPSPSEGELRRTSRPGAA